MDPKEQGKIQLINNQQNTILNLTLNFNHSTLKTLYADALAN